MAASNDNLIVAFLASGRLRADPATGHVFAPKSNTPNVPVGSLTQKGYLRIGMSLNGRQSHVMVHRVVWIACFGAPTSHMLQMNHKNGNKLDNRLENLEAVSGFDNMQHAKKSGLLRTIAGSMHYNARITPAKVDEARKRAANGERTGPIAAWLGVSTTHARRIVRGRRWACVPARDGVCALDGVTHDGEVPTC